MYEAGKVYEDEPISYTFGFIMSFIPSLVINKLLLLTTIEQKLIVKLFF